MYIANFTPDPVEWQHVGVVGTLEPDDITEFDDARAKHILNKWGARGLLKVDYEDKGREDELREQAMKMWRRFWERQVTNFNQHNEVLKNENKAYIRPPRHIEEKARELNIELVGPWKIEKVQPGADPKEFESMKSELSELKSMVSDMASMMKSVAQQRDDAIIDQFKDLDSANFREWVEDNLAKIRTYPGPIQTLIESRWSSTQGGELYPLTA